MTEQEHQAKYDEWLATRPPHVRAVAERFKPWLKHRFKDTKRPCAIYSFEEHEDSAVTMLVIAPQVFGPDHVVFGVDPDNIEEAP